MVDNPPLMKNRLKKTDYKHKRLDKHSSQIILLLNILKLDSFLQQNQLLFATQPYCISTRQGQHCQHDVACLEQEFNYTPARGRFKSRGDSLVAVKTILPIHSNAKNDGLFYPRI